VLLPICTIFIYTTATAVAGEQFWRRWHTAARMSLQEGHLCSCLFVQYLFMQLQLAQRVFNVSKRVGA
jgi:hypothetical protein